MGLAYTFDWGVLWRQPFGLWFLKGLGMTLQLGLLAWIIALFLGILVGTARITPWRPGRFLAAAYVEAFRNVPLLVQLFFWYYGGPMIFGAYLQKFINQIPHLNYYCTVFGLGLYTASRLAEHMRAGFSSIGRDQYQACLSTGLSHVQMYRYVIIPYALRIIIPPLTTEFLTIFKNSAVAMTIGVAEVTFTSARIEAETFHGLEATTGAMIIYLLLGFAVVKFMGFIEARFKVPGMIGR